MTGQFSYNLFDERWIPVLNVESKLEEVSLSDILLKIDNYVEIKDNSPLFEYSIYRFLILLIMDVFQITSQDDFESLYEDKKFDHGKIETYKQTWYNRFDLFHDTFPFYQTNLSFSNKDLKTISTLFHELPTGNNPVHFNHTLEDSHSIHPKICARALLTIPIFSLSGGRGYSPSINGTPPWYVIIKGKNLFETILFNLCFTPIEENSGTGKVQWKDDQIDYSDNEVQTVSLLEGLCFKSRFLKLIPEKGSVCTYTGERSEIVVKNMYYKAGLKFSGIWRDPFVAYEMKNDVTLIPKAGIKIWQNTGPLAFLTKDNTPGSIAYERPVNVSQYDKIQHERIVGPNEGLIIKIYGIRTRQAKQIEWQWEELKLPLEVIIIPNKGKIAQESMDIAMDVAKILRDSLYMIKALRKNHNLRNDIVNTYWNTLEPLFIESLLWNISNAAVDDINKLGEIKKDWTKQCCQIIEDIFQTNVSPINSTAVEIEDLIRAESSMKRKIYSLIQNINH